jgi:APA family basic amino acid/polyamine antiporter
MTKLNGLLVVVKLAAIAIFVFAAVPHVSAVNWEVFAPNGFFGVAAGAGFIFMAYTGFDTLATAAEECKNPNRDLPIGIIGSLLGSAILYVVVAGLLTAIVPYASLNNSEPMAHALRTNGVQIGAALVATGAIAGMTTVILTQIFGQSRILLVMARDGIMPKVFSKVHPKYSTPYVGVIVTGIIVALIAGFVPVATIGQLSSMCTLTIFGFVSLAVMLIRYKMPNEVRPFKCPAVYLVASISFILCMFLFAQLLPENWAPFLFSASLGVVGYIIFGFRNSTMRKLN